jgi:HEAT repeat protein
VPLIRRPAASPAAPTPAATLTALAHGTDDERWSAARAAADLPGGARALGLALPLERNPRVREAMFTSLARIATTESVELILPLLRSDDAALRTAALDALRAMKNVVWPYVAQLVRDADADVRLLACELVRNMPSEEAARLLCDLIEAEQQANVCASAIEVLAEIGGPEALPALARCGERFRATPFLSFSIKVAAERIGSQSPQKRA